MRRWRAACVFTSAGPCLIPLRTPSCLRREPQQVLTTLASATPRRAHARRDDAARRAGLKTVNFPRDGTDEVRADPLQRGQGRRVRPAAPGERVIARAVEAAAAFEGVAFSRRCAATGACFFSAKLRGRSLGEFSTAVAAAEAWCGRQVPARGKNIPPL